MVMPLFENTLNQMMARARLLCYDTIIPIASLGAYVYKLNRLISVALAYHNH